MPSENFVISTINLSIFYVISNPSSLASSGSSSSNSVASVLLISQLGPSRFILIGSPIPSMAHQHVGSLTRYPKFWGKGDEDVEQHWFLCEAIWRSRRNLDTNKLVEF